jgi:hypothetical protein
MSFFDKAKAAAGQAAAKAKQSAEDLQLKVDLGSAYDDLGKAAFELIEQGEIAHEKLEAPAAKVREIRQRMEGGAKPDEPATEPAPVAAEAESAPSEAADPAAAASEETSAAGEDADRPSGS